MTSADGRPPGRRIPIAAHAAILAVLLVGVALWIGARGQISVDEGAAAAQATQLADHGSWGFEHPLASVDPDGSAFPLRHADRTDDGYVPLAKHPLYPVVLSWADDLGGTAGMVGLSLVGVVGAALAAGWFAARLDPRLAVPTLYVVGLGSPLLFDGSLLIAHALGAAAVGLATVALVLHHERGATVTAWLAPTAIGLVATVLLRGEGVLLVGALAGVAGVLALRTRSAVWLATASVAAASGVGAVLLDRAWNSAVLGDGIALPRAPVAGDPWLGARLDGFGTTMLDPAYGDRPADLLLVLGAALLAVAALALRRRGDDERVAGVLAVAAAGLVVAWAATDPPSPVPGLLLAFPVLWFGLAAGRWWGSATARVAVAVSAVFALAVFATQYRQGGGFEWGARYLALALPIVVPVALAGLAAAADAVADRRTVRLVGLGLIGVTAALSVTAVRVERSLGRSAHDFGEQVVALAPPSHLGTGDADGRPVIVSAEFDVPQIVWPELAAARWLRLRDDEPIRVDGPDPRVERLLAAGVDRFTFVTRDLDRDRPLLGPVRELERHDLGTWSLVVVAPR